MNRLDPTVESITDAILHAPAWAIVGLTMQDDQIREAAAETLALKIVETIEAPVVVNDPAQLRLQL